jgi:hypothetical protein
MAWALLLFLVEMGQGGQRRLCRGTNVSAEPIMGTFLELLRMTSSRRLGVGFKVNSDRVRRSLNVGHLLFIEDALQVRMEIDGSRAALSAELKNLQRSITPPLEVSYDHLLITPPSHFRLRKVRGWLGDFCERTIIYTTNDSRAANSVKRILSQILGLPKE